MTAPQDANTFVRRFKAAFAERESLFRAYATVSQDETSTIMNKTIGSCLGWLALGVTALGASGFVPALQVMACLAVANLAYGAVKAVRRQHTLDRSLDNEDSRAAIAISALADESVGLSAGLQNAFNTAYAQNNAVVRTLGGARLENTDAAAPVTIFSSMGQTMSNVATVVRRNFS